MNTNVRYLEYTQRNILRTYRRKQQQHLRRNNILRLYQWLLFGN